MERAEAVKDKAKESRKKGRKNEAETKLDVWKNGKDNTSCGAFSNYKWAGVTDGYGKAIFKHLGLGKMEEIIKQAQATRVDECEDRTVLTAQVDLSFDEDDLVEDSDMSSECTVDNNPLSGWLCKRTEDVCNGGCKKFLIHR